ncbi:leucine--tRNA ligase [Saprospiraceae bacterium]|nr:leucine--tRNA ligase [Saprospiraceae bacterium]
MKYYDYTETEKKWREKWKADELYKVEIDTTKPKYYVLDMFPYPSGAGLHVGHPLGYISSDIYSRYKRQKGFNVLHPMGFDAFGLPAEEYAIATGVHPSISTNENIERYKVQLDNIGFSFDWSREVRTCEPSYYKWTQWIFSLLFNHYYDTATDSAQPLEKLIKIFENKGNTGNTAFNSYKKIFSAEEWNAFSDIEKVEILAEYRLAYRNVGYVNWCEGLGTVLANDQVKDGLSERGGHPVERKAMTQWNLKITAYADRLLYGLDNLEWPSSLKAIQQNWIGRSEGASVLFEIADHQEKIEIYTTRPDTIYGATFMVLAPEHPYIDSITTDDQKEAIEEYKAYAKLRSDRDRMTEVKEVTGAFTGAYATNPFSNEPIPIWISDYVLMDYGTGAIMAVPSDDDRDYAFAQKFDLPVVEVIDKSAHDEATRQDKVGTIINSPLINGMEVKEAISKMCEEIEKKNIGKAQVNYKMRDANFSRQRYWGEPFPVVYKDGIPKTVDLSELPVELPFTEDFKPTSGGKSPLARMEDWVNTPDGERETDSMPAVAGSSWYFLRYMDPHNDEEFASKEALDYWENVDLYVGGAEHAVAHLLYARFWHKFLKDLGYVKTEEPFKKLINQGMIQGIIEYIPLAKTDDDYTIFISHDILDKHDYEYAYIPVHIDYVTSYGSDNSHLTIDGINKFLEWRPNYKNVKFITADGIFEDGKSKNDNLQFVTKSEVGKMSKRYYNVVNPDDVIEKYGADTFRLYEMFLGPIEQSKPWDMQGIEGVSKFIRKFWGLFFEEENLKVSDEEPTKEEYKILHQAIKKVSDDIEKFSFNTSISAFMICTNELRKLQCNKRKILSPLVQLLSPLAPFMTEELWSLLGNTESVHIQSYPVHDDKYLTDDSFEYPICINGKKRTSKAYPTDASKDDLEKDVVLLDEVQKWIDGKNVAKIIVVPKRMINIVVK